MINSIIHIIINTILTFNIKLQSNFILLYNNRLKASILIEGEIIVKNK